MNEAVKSLSFRGFQKADQRKVRQLILEGLGEHFAVVEAQLNPDLDDINISYIVKGHAFIVAEIQGRIVGTGALVALDSETGRMVRLSVDAGHRRQGIGIALVEQLVAMAKARRFTSILVETNHDWVDAIALYHRCGFLPYASDEESIHLRLDLRTV